MFASQHPPITLSLPGQDGHTVTIRRLSFTALHAAAMLAPASAVWEWLKRKHAPGAAGAADPVAFFDPNTLLHRAVLSWDPPRESPTMEAEPALTYWLAREILKLSYPLLFKVGDNAKA